MPLPFLISAVPATFSDAPTAGLSLQQISFFGRVLTKFASAQQAQDLIKANYSFLDIYADATSLVSPGDIVDILNCGAVKVLIGSNQLLPLLAEQDVPASRLIVSLTTAEDVASLSQWICQDASRSVVSILAGANVTDLQSLKLKDSSETFRVFESASNLNERDIQKGVSPILPSVTLSFARPDSFPIKLLTNGAVANFNTGLYATVVTDEREVSLGLVWSSETSILESLKTGRGVYQSRKRGLWYKGSSSGDVQELVRIGFDCDSDCLIFVVRQKGRGFCHLGRASCFGDYHGLSLLQRTLQARKETAPAGSYTARLFNDEKLLQAKIMEEAEELCQAKSKDEVAFEAADLFYFALTRCIAAGVSLADVERNLDLKSLKLKRRTGDAKPKWVEKVDSQKEEKQEEPQASAAPVESSGPS
ncbi:trifunctional histidinol dehydrogenase, partial [Ascosphaera aggregata]